MYQLTTARFPPSCGLTWDFVCGCLFDASHRPYQAVRARPKLLGFPALILLAIRAGSSLSPHIHSVPNVHAVLRDIPEVDHTCLMSLPNRQRVVVRFFLPDICVLYIWGKWVLRAFPGKLKKTLTVRKGNLQHVCKITGSISKNGANIWTFEQLTQKLRLRIVITWFRCRVDFGR